MPPAMPSTTAGALAEASRCLEELDRALSDSRLRLGGGLDVRRVRTDLVHLRESLALLAAAVADGAEAAPGSPRIPRPGVIEISDTPYDPAMWRDADDEGIGCRHR
ncbi:hypothetical protein ABH941_007203 [Streptacidiphilus sp. EB103A]